MKYRHIIKKLFPPEQPKIGKGKGSRLLTKSVNSSDTSRCGDPDAMTERLALLVTSALLVNIIESLKKDGIVSGDGNDRNWDLIK